MKGDRKIEMGWPCTGQLTMGLVSMILSPDATRPLGSHLLDYLCCLQISPVEDLLVAVHPDLSQAHLIACNDTGALGEGVRTLGSEHVAYHGAGDDLQLASTLPYLTQKMGPSGGWMTTSPKQFCSVPRTPDSRCYDGSKCRLFYP